MFDTLQNDLSIADLLRGDLQLSSPPTIYFELQKIIEHPDKSLADAAFIIEKDSTLSLKLLKIVNSSFYGFPSKISSIDRAITLIGTQELQQLALCTIVIEKFSDLPGELLSMADFWARSLRCALIAQEIDSFLNKEFADSIFVCGMLHNIGQLVFFRRLPELSREVSLIQQSIDYSSDNDEITLEENVIGFNHYQTGAELTQLWKLPELITESIRLHPYSDTSEPYNKIASIIRLADFYSKNELAESTSHINTLGISIENITALIDQSNENFEEILKVFT